MIVEESIEQCTLLEQWKEEQKLILKLKGIVKMSCEFEAKNNVRKNFFKFFQIGWNKLFGKEEDPSFKN